MARVAAAICRRYNLFACFSWHARVAGCPFFIYTLLHLTETRSPRHGRGGCAALPRGRLFYMNSTRHTAASWGVSLAARLRRVDLPRHSSVARCILPSRQPSSTHTRRVLSDRLKAAT